MVICAMESGGKMQFSVSKKLISKLENVDNETKTETHITFSLHDDVPMENPFEGLYIDRKYFPVELLQE